MNIFALSYNPVEAARWAINKHVIKMVLETAQLLSAVSYQYGIPGPYKRTHQHHPCTLWAAETWSNWNWLCEYGIALSEEYERRYQRVHGSRSVIFWAADYGGRPKLRSPDMMTPFPQVMPEHYRKADPVEAYRAFYVGEKSRFAAWKSPASPPPWWPDLILAPIPLVGVP